MLQLPAPLAELAERQWQRLLGVAPADRDELLAAAGPDQTAIWPFGLYRRLGRPGTRAVAGDWRSGVWQCADRTAQYGSQLAHQLAAVTTEEELKRTLRRFRRQQMMVIAWRELAGLSQVEESFSHLSLLAEELITQALGWLYGKGPAASRAPP